MQRTFYDDRKFEQLRSTNAGYVVGHNEDAASSTVSIFCTTHMNGEMNER